MTQIDIKLSAIYRAAHDELPAKATEFASQADAITAGVEPLAAQLALAGNHPIASDTSDLAMEIFSHLRTMVMTFNDSAVALDRIADAFAEDEGQIAEHWRRQHQYLTSPDVAPLPAVPEV